MLDADTDTGRRKLNERAAAAASHYSKGGRGMMKGMQSVCNIMKQAIEIV